MKILLTLSLTIIAFGAIVTAGAVSANAQINIPGAKKLVVKDTNFPTQKRAAGRLFGYEVWITTDGVVHIISSSAITEASVKFTRPTTSATGTGGTTTSAGGSEERKVSLTLKRGSAYEYAFSIAGDGYTAMHSITVNMNINGGKASAVLTNSKVPAAITN